MEKPMNRTAANHKPTSRNGGIATIHATAISTAGTPSGSQRRIDHGIQVNVEVTRAKSPKARIFAVAAAARAKAMIVAGA